MEGEIRERGQRRGDRRQRHREAERSEGKYQ